LFDEITTGRLLPWKSPPAPRCLRMAEPPPESPRLQLWP
jgi:hypothetical protein